MKGLVLTLVLVLLVAGCLESIPEGVETGQKAPDFTVETFDGKMVSLSDYKGKPVVLHFFDSFCAECQADSANVAQIYPEFKDDISYLGIFIDPWEKPEFVAKYVKKHGLTGDFVPSNRKVILEYFVISPTLKYFIDEDGVIVLKDTGAYSTDEWMEALESLRAKEEVNV